MFMLMFIISARMNHVFNLNNSMIDYVLNVKHLLQHDQCLLAHKRAKFQPAIVNRHHFIHIGLQFDYDMVSAIHMYAKPFVPINLSWYAVDRMFIDIRYTCRIAGTSIVSAWLYNVHVVHHYSKRYFIWKSPFILNCFHVNWKYKLN
jgi:hypothetical protein